MRSDAPHARAANNENFGWLLVDDNENDAMMMVCCVCLVCVCVWEGNVRHADETSHYSLCRTRLRARISRGIRCDI